MVFDLNALHSGRQNEECIITVGMKWNDLRLILLTLGVVVALYALFLTFGPFAPAGH